MTKWSGGGKKEQNGFKAVENGNDHESDIGNTGLEAGRLGLVGAEEEEEEEEEEDLFVFNDSIEGPRAPTVKPGRRERVWCLLVLNSVTFAPQ